MCSALHGRAVVTWARITAAHPEHQSRRRHPGPLPASIGTASPDSSRCLRPSRRGTSWRRRQGVELDERLAPGAVGDGRNPVESRADLGAHGADSPAHDSGPRLVLMERPMLALVGHVRLRRDALVRAEEPDVVARGALDRLPAHEARRARVRLRGVRPTHEPQTWPQGLSARFRSCEPIVRGMHRRRGRARPRPVARRSGPRRRPRGSTERASRGR